MIELGFVTKLTELEMHQLAYRLNGLKFCDAKGNVVGVVNEALRTWDGCSMEMKDQVLGYTMRHSMSTTLSTARVFGLVLEHFHLQCPHVAYCQDFTEWENMCKFAAESGIEPVKRYSICQICLENVSG